MEIVTNVSEFKPSPVFDKRRYYIRGYCNARRCRQRCYEEGEKRCYGAFLPPPVHTESVLIRRPTAKNVC